VTLEDERLVRLEAKQFCESQLGQSQLDQPIDDFHKIKSRLSDFYSPVTKALFLDELQKQIFSNLEEHRIAKHGGTRSPNCQYEIDYEKLLFYIKQEIGTFPQIAHQRFVSITNHIRSKVFISYSHLDSEYLTDIQRHFKPFLNRIDIWDDSRIQPGQKWKEEIGNAVHNTKIAILLVSTDFLGSEFIASHELPPLLQAAEKEGAVILSIIVKPCLFEEFSEINRYQALNPPSRPVSKMDGTQREELFVNLVRQVIRILKQDGQIQ
jgi:hypothetical protein